MPLATTLCTTDGSHHVHQEPPTVAPAPAFPSSFQAASKFNLKRCWDGGSHLDELMLPGSGSKTCNNGCTTKEVKGGEEPKSMCPRTISKEVELCLFFLPAPRAQKLFHGKSLFWFRLLPCAVGCGWARIRC
ncbi:hypothetical protein PIB30_059242 [Stylosanthes scabra]|uniref:Uncharacterized protein n=1 Tax=Stylosanthes scabra TaxID=79078 RepID=A0ABU6UJN5_9FABA|nr:hypothetical protein [Stylosanthes scabra]